MGLGQNPVKTTAWLPTIVGVEVALDGANSPVANAGYLHGRIPLDPLIGCVHTSTGLYTFQLNQNAGGMGLSYLSGQGGLVIGAEVHAGVGGTNPAPVDIMAMPYGLFNLSGQAVNSGSAVALKPGQFQIQLLTPGTTTPVDPPAKATNACLLSFMLFLFDSSQQD